MKTVKVDLPTASILFNTDFDYVDGYQGTYLDKGHKISSKDIAKAFFTSGPGWAEKLFEFRNKLVSMFGLKTPKKENNLQEILDNFTCEPNERVGLFKVYNRTENEVILGEDDKHLNFRISLFKEDANKEGTKKLIISTTVKFNNWFGKLYFFPVKPFHKLIVPKMLTGIIKQIEEGTVD